MQSFDAMLYGPGLPAGGIPVVARFGIDSLHVDEPPRDADAALIDLRVGGFEHDEIFLSWRDADGGDYSLKPADRSATQFVAAHAPAALREQLRAWHHRRRMIRGVWSTIGAIAATVLIGAGLLWWRYDDVVTWLADRVSIANEKKLGDTVLKQLEEEGDIIEDGAAVDAVRAIGQRLTPASSYEYRWLVQRDRTVNAFALPGGIIVVNSGLIQAIENADELAAVLAHEVQHVEQRHALKNMINNLGWAAGLLVVAGDVNAAAVLVLHQLGNNYFSRGVEEEADRIGYDTLVAAKIAPQGMVTLLEKLDEAAPDGGPEWLSSHPDTARRIAAVRQLLQQRPCMDCAPLAYDWSAVQNDVRLARKSDD